MLENPITECLFIGGTANGNRLPVSDVRQEFPLSSLADVTNDPQALDDGDPRPEKLPVVEIYRPVAVKHDYAVETVFALNALSNEAIQVQLVKHFGSGVSFT